MRSDGVGFVSIPCGYHSAESILLNCILGFFTQNNLPSGQIYRMRICYFIILI